MQKQLNEEFIEDYSEEFATLICDKFFESKTHITGQEILTATPSKQVNLFVIKLLFNNWQDESKRLESPFFDYSSNEVKEAMVQFMNTLSRSIKVARKEFDILLQDAIRDTLFFIMSPNVYIEIEMDRKGTETLTEKSAKNIVKYLRIAKEEFSAEIMTQVGKDRDDLKLNESLITDEIIEFEISLFNSVLPLSLKKLEEGEDAEETDENIEIPIPESEVSEKEFSQEKKSENNEEIEKEEVKKETEPVLETTTLEGPSQETEPEEIGSEDSQNSDSVIETPDEKTQNFVEAVMEAAEEEEIIDESSEPEHVASPQPEVITNLHPDDEDEDDEDAILNSKFEDPMVGSIAEKHEAETDSMLSAISLNHRYMFINELFDGDADLFAEAINRVDNSASFDASVEMLVQNYAKDFHWDMNSDEVKELLKIIFRRFR